MKSSLIFEPLIHLNRFKPKTKSCIIFSIEGQCGFYEMHIRPQISGDCRAFVSAEALFSSRFMIVAGSWQELV